MDNSPFVVDDLWGSVLEELRAECADAYEVVMRVRPMGNGERGNAPSQENVIRKRSVYFQFWIAEWECGAAKILAGFHNLRPLAPNHTLRA